MIRIMFLMVDTYIGPSGGSVNRVRPSASAAAVLVR